MSKKTHCPKRKSNKSKNDTRSKNYRREQPNTKAEKFLDGACCPRLVLSRLSPTVGPRVRLPNADEIFERNKLQHGRPVHPPQPSCPARKAAAVNARFRTKAMTRYLSRRLPSGAVWKKSKLPDGTHAVPPFLGQDATLRCSRMYAGSATQSPVFFVRVGSGSLRPSSTTKPLRHMALKAACLREAQNRL